MAASEPLLSESAGSLHQQRVHAAKASGGTSQEVIYQAILQVIASRSLGGDVLDFGAGVGHLTGRLLNLNRFRSVTGTDLLPRPVHLPPEIAWHHHDLNHPVAIPAAAFDTLIAAEVIEHLENPREIAREWYRLLRPGGVLLLSTPNNESIRSLVALLFRGHYVAFDDSCYPAHITALLRKDLTRILTEAGFTNIRFQFTNHGGLPKMPLITWQQSSANLLKGLRFSDNLLAIADKRTP